MQLPVNTFKQALASQRAAIDNFLKGGIGPVAGFLAKHLNVEIGINLRSDRWAGADYWQAQADKALTLEQVLERSDVVTIGIDGGGLDEIGRAHV